MQYQPPGGALVTTGITAADIQEIEDIIDTIWSQVGVEFIRFRQQEIAHLRTPSAPYLFNPTGGGTLVGINDEIDDVMRVGVRGGAIDVYFVNTIYDKGVYS